MTGPREAGVKRELCRARAEKNGGEMGTSGLRI